MQRSPAMVQHQLALTRSKVYTGDFLEFPFKKSFDILFAQAFLHLFPDVWPALDRLHALCSDGGLLHFSTTVHEEASEGWEVKEDYHCHAPARFRRRYSPAVCLFGHCFFA